MNKLKIFVKSFTIFVVLFGKGLCRKYDIEDESIKLYGEDLKSVLKRFRRTPDYLAILNDKLAEFKEYYLNDVLLQTLYYYDSKLVEKIDEIYPNDEQESSTAAVDPVSYLRNHFNRYPSFEGIFNPNKLRQSEVVIVTTEKTPVEILENYKHLTSSLTLQERNMFRDMGFEFAGKIIHSIIKAMGNEDFGEKSTRLPMEGKTSSTTEHAHEVQSTQAAEVAATDETFKYKYRAPKMARIKTKH